MSNPMQARAIFAPGLHCKAGQSIKLTSRLHCDLHGELQEEIYMLPPPGLERLFTPRKVLRLKRQVYGLSQSGRVFYKLLAAAMRDLGFKSVTDDDCVWRLTHSYSELIVATVVDDMIQVTNDDALLKEFNDFLRSRFTITDNGRVEHFLGVHFTHSDDGLHASQEGFI
eukprot:213199-Rhodomonas_salina.2